MNILEQIQSHRAALQAVNKRILKKDISTNQATLSKYKADSVAAFNTFSTVLHALFGESDNKLKLVIHQNFLYATEKFQEILLKLNLTANVPTLIGETINIDTVLPNLNPDTTQSPTADPNDTAEFASMSEEETETANMSLSTPNFLKLCAATINRNYNGEPLALAAFVNSVELLKQLATTDPLRDLLTIFLKAKLEGKALESIPTTVANADAIVDALKAKIKPDSSKVIEGRMQALRTNRKSLQEFSKEAEDLADAFQRSLIVEGIPQTKAEEMAIERTVDICRASARTDIVKSVLASTKFESPKAAIAKFIIETGNATKEHQILSFRSNRPNPNSNQNGNRNSPNQNQNFSRNNNHQFRNNANRGSHGNQRNHNQSRNPNFLPPAQRNNNNAPNRNQNGSGQHNQGNGNRQYNGNYRNVRAYGQENSSAPQQMSLGAAQMTQMATMPQIPAFPFNQPNQF